MSEPAAAKPKNPPVSWMGAVGLRLLGRRGARIGLVWIVFLALGAVFAPLLASSFPWVWREGGATSYPLLANLGPVDWVLLWSFFSAVGLVLARRVRLPARASAWAWLTLAAIPSCGWRVWRDMADHAPWPAWDHAWSRDERLSVVFWLGWGFALAAGAAVLAWMAAATRASGRFKGCVLAAALALAAVCVLRPIHPPEIFDHQHYRVAEAAHEGSGTFTLIPYSPQDTLSDLGNTAYLKPGRDHWFGTDTDGHDLASRMIHACRVSLSVGLLSTSIALAIGVVIGGLMGYYAGWFDMIGMRLVDIFSAVPRLLVLIMICAFYERNIYLMMVILGLFGWVGYAVFIRAEFLRLRSSDFVQAARAVGASTPRILVRHLLPNGVTPVLTLASFSVAGAIMIEASLSFIGLGLPPDAPSWGQPLEKAAEAGPEKWWVVVFPCAAIFLTVFAYNLVGEALRDALDPKQNK